LAGRVVERRAGVKVTDEAELEVDLTMVMAGFEFETVWSERRTFPSEGVEIPVARLMHIVQSKAAAGRVKDRLFLATHRDRLEQPPGHSLAAPAPKTEHDDDADD